MICVSTEGETTNSSAGKRRNDDNDEKVVAAMKGRVCLQAHHVPTEEEKSFKNKNNKTYDNDKFFVIGLPFTERILPISVTQSPAIPTFV
jgi:hypothetical protein